MPDYGQPPAPADGFLTPELLAQLQQMRSFGKQKEMLDMDRQRIEMLRKPYSGGPTAASRTGQNVANIFRSAGAAYQDDDLRQKEANLNQQGEATRAKLLEAMQKAESPDVSSLFFADDASAAGKAAEYAKALRGQKQLANLAASSGDPQLSALAKNILEGTQQQEGVLLDFGKSRQTNAFNRDQSQTEALRAFARQQAGDEAAMARARFTSGEETKRHGMTVKQKEEHDKAASEAAQKKHAQDAEGDLRKQYLDNPQTKDLLKTTNAFRAVQAATPSGAGDIGLIYNFLHQVEPGSAVKEGEFSTAGATGGLPGMVQGYFNKMNAQGILPDNVRKQLKEESKNLMRSSLGGSKPFRESFRGLANQYGAAPERVVMPLGLEDVEASLVEPQAAAPGGPPPGVTPEKWARYQELKRLQAARAGK